MHALFCLARTREPAEVVKEMKRGSNLWLKESRRAQADFSWPNGYGMFSIGFSQVEQVRSYIRAQETHHARVSFQDEFRLFLRRYAMEYDERYVWD